jgi:hypothetical protein
MPGLVEEDVDLGVIESLDFEPVEACEMESPACTVTATCMIRCRLCRKGLFACGDCVLWVRLAVAQAVLESKGGLAVMCTLCGFVAPDFTGLWEVTPMKGGL